jgi:hypothetical protein
VYASLYVIMKPTKAPKDHQNDAEILKHNNQTILKVIKAINSKHASAKHSDAKQQTPEKGL